MKTKIKCFDSKCSGDETDLRYVCQSVEYHQMESMPDEDGNVDLCWLEESYPDELFAPYITCNKCGRDFNLDGTEKK